MVLCIGAHGVLGALSLILPALFHPGMWKLVEDNSDQREDSPVEEKSDDDATDEGKSSRDNEAYINDKHANQPTKC